MTELPGDRLERKINSLGDAVFWFFLAVVFFIFMTAIYVVIEIHEAKKEIITSCQQGVNK